MKKKTKKAIHTLLYIIQFLLSVQGAAVLEQRYIGVDKFYILTGIYCLLALGYIGIRTERKETLIKGNKQYIQDLKKNGDISEYVAESIVKDLDELND